MQVAEVWRYPVKSMAGERVGAAEVDDTGLRDDRRLAVFELAPRPSPKRLSARDVPGLLRFRARQEAGTVLVEGPAAEPLPWDAAELRRQLEAVCRRRLELRPMPQGAFDDAPVLVLYRSTLEALSEELGSAVDGRRFRANLYLEGGGLESHQEGSLVGRSVRCGEVTLRGLKPCPRCSITTRDPDTWASWPGLLRHLVQRHDQVVGVYCGVEHGGRLQEGDQVEFD